uniref:Toll-like receptor n=1 Tax=Anadara kagoshimensis TaxID=1390362 RepID=A0A7H0S6E4_9BIVA|nr:toll-like receptor [Anadara sativa]
MKSLKTIRFDKCELLELKNDTFKNLSSSVENLYMTNCKDISPRVGIAAFEHFVKLKILDLSNSLISLPSAMDLLYGLQNNSMEEINFYKVNTNELADKINPYSVTLNHQNTYYLRNICVKRLNLAFNEIVEVRRKSLFSLKRMDCLEDFIVSGNRFDLVYSVHLVDMMLFINKGVNLRYFDFSFMAVEFPNYLYPYTPIKTGHKKFKRSSLFSGGVLVFNCPPKWHTLRMTRNLWSLQNIRNMDFKGCKNFRVLDLSYSSIQFLNFNITGIETTETVDISGIDISTIFPLLLYSVPNLKTLIINSVNLDKLFDKPMGLRLFSILKYIEKIEMTKNHVNNIPTLVFRGLLKLQHINLSQNALEEFPEALLSVKSIRTLDLSDNKLTTLSQAAISWLENAARENGNITVYLKGNLLSCKCENSKFIEWLFSTKVKFDNMKNYSCLLGGGEISNTIFVNEHFSDVFINCVSTFWLVFSVVFSALMLFTLIASVIAFRFRWRISYFFHRYLRQDIQLLDMSEYVYDAFVAYPADDYQWIWREMRVQMENNYGLKLCLHDREFVPGETISQNIHDFMQKSKKIIFDVTPGFVDARWFDYELEMARMDMMERRNNNGIIVIIRNGIQPEHMPRAFNNIWHSITCLSWPDDEDDVVTRAEAEEMFWRRLRDVLES